MGLPTTNSSFRGS
uniref:Uncharacterized protein n=1 Tax=Arundo donax TaxID=35708 RepID=A0A0A8YIL5_ARUDO